MTPPSNAAAPAPINAPCLDVFEKMGPHAIVERYRNELTHPVYQHAAPFDELRWHLDLED